MLGVSNETVRKAVTGGKIVKGWCKKEQKIIVEKANEEWGNTYINNNAEVERNETEARSHFAKVTQEPPQAKAKPQAKPQRPPIDPEDTEAAALLELEDFGLHSKTPFAEGLRVEKVAKAQLAVLELKEKTGELVSKAEVYKQLFAFGQAVRQAVLAVPDRCIDEILAAPHRAGSYVVLGKYLHEALETLANSQAMQALENKTEE